MRHRLIIWTGLAVSLIIFVACVVFGLGQGG
jgi:hypothetical protein